MHVVDLTRPLGPGTPVYPGDPPVAVEDWTTHDADGYRVSRLSLGSHAGTHLDAPAHTEPDPDAVPGPYTVEEFPVETFRFTASLVDLTAATDRDPIGVADLPDPATLPEAVDLLVLDTGWHAHWGTARYRDHPYLAADAAASLAESGYHVALDAFSVDPTPPADPGDDASATADDGTADEPAGVPAHHARLGAGRIVVENLANLDALAGVVDPGTAFEVRAYPLPVVDGDGSPVRAVAEVP